MRYAILVLLAFASSADAQQIIRRVIQDRGERYSQTTERLTHPLNPRDIALRVPITDDAKVNEILRDSTFFKLPRVHQVNESDAGVVEIVEDSSGRIIERRTTARAAPRRAVVQTSQYEGRTQNQQFPFEVAAGLNIAWARGNKVSGTVNFLKLPPGAPVLAIVERPVKWVFPQGAVVGEIIYTAQDGVKWPQEIRMRTKGKTTWVPQVLRPVATREELHRLVGDFGHRKTFLRVGDESKADVPTEGWLDVLPGMSPAVVKFLLDRPFRDVTHTDWSAISSAPTSAFDDFSLVPKEYSLGLFRANQSSCASCHKRTGSSGPDGDLVRGSDGVFTWHPFWTGPVAQQDPTAVDLRRLDIERGWVKLFDRSMVRDGRVELGGARYRLTGFVRDENADGWAKEFLGKE